jgi:hypothetical protein
MSKIEDALEIAKESESVAELREAHKRVLRQLEKAKRSQDELVEAVYNAARDAAAGMRVPPVPTPKIDKRKKDGEVAVLLLADWQVGKVTPTYNSEVAADRVKKLAEKVEKLVAIQREDHPVREAYVFLLGDFVEGDGNIFPGQSYLVDSSLYSQIFSTAEMLAGLIRKLAANFEKVHVVGVIGNHGRLGRYGESAPESNADAIAYRTAAMLVRDEKRITWKETYTKGERHWHEYVEVLGRKWLLFHGDQLKGGSFGFPWYSLAKRLGGWSLALDGGKPDYAAFGHWHTPVRVVAADGRITAFGAGSIESSNTYAQEWVAASGEPAQWLIFQAPSGLSAEYLVRLES